MTNSRRLATLLLLAPGLLAALACAPRQPASPSSASSLGAPPGAMAVRLDDHLGCGRRLEAISVRVDGRPVFRQADAVRVAVPKELGTITLEPGVHAV